MTPKDTIEQLWIEECNRLDSLRRAGADMAVVIQGYKEAANRMTAAVTGVVVENNLPFFALPLLVDATFSLYSALSPQGAAEMIEDLLRVAKREAEERASQLLLDMKSPKVEGYDVDTTDNT